MINPTELEEAYQLFCVDLSKSLPDGIVEVNMELLASLNLLNNEGLEDTTDNLMHYFHVIETNEKVTLFNEQFAIWIVPQGDAKSGMTLTYISLLTKNKPHLEIVYRTSGVYNTPKYILKVLQHYLNEVIDTESVLSTINKAV